MTDTPLHYSELTQAYEHELLLAESHFRTAVQNAYEYLIQPLINYLQKKQIPLDWVLTSVDNLTIYSFANLLPQTWVYTKKYTEETLRLPAHLITSNNHGFLILQPEHTSFHNELDTAYARYRTLIYGQNNFMMLADHIQNNRTPFPCSAVIHNRKTLLELPHHSAPEV